MLEANLQHTLHCCNDGLLASFTQLLQGYSYVNMHCLRIQGEASTALSKITKIEIIIVRTSALVHSTCH
jgi:hypothetical protein